MRVLHVTECLAGGVQTALAGYVKATPELDHVVLANSRRGHNITMREVEGSSAFYVLPTNHLAAVKKVAKVAREVRPDVIHAHSSFAGAYSRIATLCVNVPVVYTPHAIAYGRPDFSFVKRAAYKGVEKLLSWKTKVFAGCSVHESELLSDLNARVPVVTIPNALPPDHPAQELRWGASSSPVVGMVGRINEYRDPQCFIDIVESVRRHNSDVEFVWIGDGDDAQRDALKAAGVHVTGWLGGVDLQKRLTELSMLVYTSRWDGFPMVILEAINSHVPTFVSNIAPLKECPESARFDTAEQASSLVLKQLEQNQPLSQHWDPLRAAHSFDSQKQALIRAYELATVS